MLQLKQRSGKDTGNADEILCEQYLPGVFRYISFWINSSRKAEDLTLTVLKKALTRTDNECLDEERFSFRVFTTARKVVESHSGLNESKVLSCREKEQIVHLAGMGSLSHEEREAIALKFGAGLLNHNIARITGTSESTVGSLIRQALDKLRFAKDSYMPNRDNFTGL